VVATKPSEKYESVGMMTFPTELKNTKCSNHQPGINVVLLISKNGDIKRDIYTKFKSTVHVRYMIICADVRKISYH
jgi:hypothetical protein